MDILKCFDQFSNPEVFVWNAQNDKYLESASITLDNKFQKFFFISDEYVTNLFACVYQVRKGT